MFTYDTDEGYCSLTGFTGRIPSRLVIPEEIHGLPVGAIRDNAFSECDALRKVVLPSSIKKIGHFAFAWCPNLNYVNLDNVKEVYSDSFIGTGILDFEYEALLKARK